MKKTIFMPLIMALGVMTFSMSSCNDAQKSAEAEAEACAENDTIYDMPDVAASFVGGEDALANYLAENIQYPAEALADSIEGQVIVGFVVNNDGSVCDATVVNTPDDNLAEEALRVVEGMPNWEPGSVDGKPARTRFNLPIRFRLQ